MADELILVVEDDELSRKVLRDVLRAQGYQIVATDRAEEGIEIARGQQPRLVLMDIQLPGMDGITAMKQLKSDPATQHIPVIAVTASAAPRERARIVAEGFDGYQHKPLSVKAFLAELRRVLGA